MCTIAVDGSISRRLQFEALNATCIGGALWSNSCRLHTNHEHFRCRTHHAGVALRTTRGPPCWQSNVEVSVGHTRRVSVKTTAETMTL